MLQIEPLVAGDFVLKRVGDFEIQSELRQFGKETLKEEGNAEQEKMLSPVQLK